MSTWYVLDVIVGLLHAQTHGWVRRYNWGQHSVDTSSCLQGRNKDLTPAAVRYRHQLGLEPEKMSFTSSFNDSHKSALPSSTPFNFSFIFVFSFIRPTSFPSPYTSLSKASASQSLPPYFPFILPSSKTFPVTQHWFSANFSSLLEQHLCGTVALDFSDDFIQPLLAWAAVNSSTEWGLLRVAWAVCCKQNRGCDNWIRSVCFHSAFKHAISVFLIFPDKIHHKTWPPVCTKSTVGFTGCLNNKWIREWIKFWLSMLPEHRDHSIWRTGDALFTPPLPSSCAFAAILPSMWFHETLQTQSEDSDGIISSSLRSLPLSFVTLSYLSAPRFTLVTSSRSKYRAAPAFHLCATPSVQLGVIKVKVRMGLFLTVPLPWMPECQMSLGDQYDIWL